MDFDMTQVVTHSDTEGEDEENEKSAPVAHIKVLNQPSLKKKLYPILKGDNTVGRHDLCQISIPVRSLSKKHACIEVRGRSHFIYDMGSRNKTRRGTHYLTPEVRYELRNNDMVVFADVSCIYLVEDSARASDSGSETDPMSDSETVFHTVAVDMYNSVEPTVNRVVEPELIDVAVTSDPNSCDSAASSDILMPTQDFAVMKIKQESQNQKEAVPSNESPVIKNASKEAIKFLVVDSDSENERETLNTKETLRFQNNGNNEDSLDMELLAAPTQVYVADSEDDDNKSEILDMVHDYKTTDNSFFVADTQSDDSPKPPVTDSEEPRDGKTDRNGSASPFRTSFAGSPRTYSKKDACNKSKPEIMPSESINTAKKDEEKPVEEDCEETQDPNLFALSTLAPDENILHCPTSPDSKSSPTSPSSNKNTTLNTTNDETETVPADGKDILPVSSEGATVPVNSEEAETAPVTNDTADTQMISDQEASVAVSDTIPVTSQNAISLLANKDSDNNIILDNKAPLFGSGQDLATVEITTDETMVIALDIDVRDTETVEVDQLQEDSSQQKQSKEDNSGAEPPLKLEESDLTESKSHPETCTTSTPSKEPSSPFQLLSDIENCTKAQKEPVPKNVATPVKGKKGNPLNADLLSDVSVGIFDAHVSIPLPVTPSAKGKSPKIPMRQSDDEILEATQPYMIDCLDSPPVQKKNVKAKRSLPFDVGITKESDANNQDETQPYMLEDNKQAVESPSCASFRRGADHEISDDEEEVSVKASPKEKSLKNVTSYQESDTLPLLAENESDTDKIVSESEGSQTSRSTAGRNGSKTVQAVKGLKEETDTSLKTGQETQNVELTKTEELQSEEKFPNAPKEFSSLVNAKMTETSKLSKVLQSEEASPSASMAQMILGEKRTTRRSSKDSEESGEAANLKPNRRGRKRKTAEEKESADNVALPAEHVGAEMEVEEEEIGSKTKRTRRSVHFIGISSSDEYSQESTETRSSRSRRNLKESQGTENETVGRKTRGRTSNAQGKGKKGTVSKKTDVTGTEASSSKGRRSRGRKSKIDDDDDDNQKDPQTTGKTEKDELAKTSVIVNQCQSKRAATVLDECSEMHNKNSTEETKRKKPRGRRSKTNNDTQNEVSETSGNARTDGAEEMIVAKETSEEMPILENEVNAEILKKSSEVISDPTTQSSTVEVSVEEGVDRIEIDASKLTTKTSGQELTENTETRIDDDSQKARTSRNTRSEKSKDEDRKEEKLNETKTKVTEAPSNKRVSRTSKSQAKSNTATFEDSEMVSENYATTESTPKTKRGKPRKGKQTNSQKSEIAPEEEPPVNKRASRSTKRSSQEEKIPQNTATTLRSSRSGRAKKEKDQDAEELTANDKASQKHIKNDSEESADMNKTTRTRRDQKSKMTKNSRKDNEASKVDDDDDFVAPVGRGQSSEKKTVSQEKALSPPPQKSSNVSSDSFENSDSMDLAKQEPKTPTARKRNQSSHSSSQSSPFTSPKRQQLNSSLSPNTPSSRSLSSGSKPKVMFTGVTDDKLQKIVTDLGGSVVMGFDSCTHLVTDKIRRTVKFLCCLARGIPIVSPSWLTNCKTAKMFIDHTTHLVSDPNTEKQYKFSLKNSLQHARAGPLLENYKIHVTKSVKPNVDQMKEIMDSCKAQFLKRMPSEEAENTIVISCEEDRTLCQPALDAGIPIVNAEFILTGILQYSISVSKYQIFDSSSGSKRKLVATDKGNAKRRRR